MLVRRRLAQLIHVAQDSDFLRDIRRIKHIERRTCCERAAIVRIIDDLRIIHPVQHLQSSRKRL